MSAEQDNVPGFPPQVNIFLNLYVSLPAPSSNHSHASRYPYHLGFLPFNPGNNRKLFTRAIAPTGSKYQTSPASSPCSTTRAASTSISRAASIAEHEFLPELFRHVCSLQNTYNS